MGFGLMHLICVRGSPLLRTMLVLGVLCVSALGFARLTGGGGGVPVEERGAEVEEDANAPIETIRARVHVVLSESAKRVKIFAGAGFFWFGERGDGVYFSEIKIAKEDPVLEFEVEWLDGEGGGTRRFAKLVVEAEGEETFTHVFDAEGDIDDVVELPF